MLEDAIIRRNGQNLHLNHYERNIGKKYLLYVKGFCVLCYRIIS